MIASRGRFILTGTVALALATAAPAALAKPLPHAAGRHAADKKPAAQQERVDFTAAEAASAWPEGLP
ncbi:hypothetical protein, partial [Methylobacterium haplocladii]